MRRNKLLVGDFWEWVRHYISPDRSRDAAKLPFVVCDSPHSAAAAAEDDSINLSWWWENEKREGLRRARRKTRQTDTGFELHAEQRSGNKSRTNIDCEWCANRRQEDEINDVIRCGIILVLACSPRYRRFPIVSVSLKWKLDQLWASVVYARCECIDCQICYVYFILFASELFKFQMKRRTIGLLSQQQFYESQVSSFSYTLLQKIIKRKHALMHGMKRYIIELEKWKQWHLINETSDFFFCECSVEMVLSFSVTHFLFTVNKFFKKLNFTLAN